MEKVLLSFLVHSLPPCSSRDIPVYLPYGSPKVWNYIVSNHSLVVQTGLSFKCFVAAGYTKTVGTHQLVCIQHMWL